MPQDKDGTPARAEDGEKPLSWSRSSIPPPGSITALCGAGGSSTGTSLAFSRFSA